LVSEREAKMIVTASLLWIGALMFMVQGWPGLVHNYVSKKTGRSGASS